MNLITKIEVQKKNKERVNIYIDEEYAFSVNAELVYKENLKVKTQVNYEQLKRVVEEENYMKCKNSALKIIERSYKTKKEIRDKLIQKGYDEKAIERAIDFLNEYKLQDDSNYTKMYVNDKKKSVGSKKLKYDLLRKGIDEETIANELSQIDDEDEYKGALELCMKKYRVLSKRENDEYKLSQKLYRFLLSKGYSYDLISKVVKEVTTVSEY